ncbi:MAG: aldo/keto reductase [Anaerolineae bacterium]|nr:aldo/keto reductase [Anaerolineae bacterium]
MQQMRLGKTGLTISALGFGGIPIQRLTEAEAIRVVQHCLDLGITFIDTAHGYTTSEERIGKAISGRREGLILATKSHALSGDAFRGEMEASFERLQVDYIDIYQFHNISTEEQFAQITAPGGPLDVAREAVAAGRIGHIGATSHSLDMALKLAASGLFETLMFPFNFITSEPADELVPLCRRNDVGFIAMKPIGGGMLEDVKLAFQWLRQFPTVLPLVGIQSHAEIDEIVAVMEGPAEISPAEWAEIQRLQAELGKRFCRSCDYCQPCPQEIRISSVLRLRSFARRMPPERLHGAWGRDLIATAETCIDCGECEARCPYELPIREMTREMIAWYHEEIAPQKVAS